MHTMMLKLRGPFIALVALALSAGMAFAAPPDKGLSNAAEHAGKTVPVGPGNAQQDADKDKDKDKDKAADEDENEEAEDADGDHCSTDPRTLSAEELAALNHGAIVCWAAHQTTWPDEFKNHGQWVSSWARQNHGAEASADKTDD